MKIIFLDIDGVINSAFEWVPMSERGSYPINTALWDVHDLTPKYIGRLNEIVDATGAKVVISSSWRIQYKHTELAKMLKTQGFTGEVIGETPIFSRTPDGVAQDRGDEIKFWINTHDDIDSFVILDDTDFDGIVDYFYPQFVHIKKSTGLLPKHVEQAIKILNAKPHDFFYLCRKCGRKIPARFSDNFCSAKMVEVKKNNYEFECKFVECDPTDTSS